jgi:hypothetical protein
MKKYIFVTLTVLVSLQLLTNCRNHYQFAFQNPQRPVKVRVNDLISHMTLEE